ncbi:MAG: Na+/H+ antiporter NhaA, partial [Beijerinckiaceae bacterium]
SIVLLSATILALIVANSVLGPAYKSALATPIGFDFGPIHLKFTVKDWVKNALMAVFFLLVGLEIKAEFREGALADPARAVLPFIAAFGGMAVPAFIYLGITYGPDDLDRGWAIPSATDIAFAVGVMGLLGRLVPGSLRAFLLAVAVIDDLGAILVIALFYTGTLKAWAILGCALCLLALTVMNLKGVARLWPYLTMGFVLWFFTLQSGINATLAGVLTAAFVPLRIGDKSPLHALVHRLHAPVNFGIMPVFAFVAAGVSLKGLSLASFGQPLTLAVMAGLTLGKPIGIFGSVWLSVRSGISVLPQNVSWGHILGAGCLAGIGFTMSLFVGALAFSDEALLDQVRLGVLVGSALSAIVGAGVLYATRRRVG